MYGSSFLARLRTYQRWYAGTPYEYVEQFVPKEGSIVDLGCGWGMFANLLALKSPSRQVLGMDLDGVKITWAQDTIKDGRTNIRFVLKDLGELEISKIDAIVLYDVMHHLDESVQFGLLNQCYEKLSPGGKLILKENDVVPLWKFFFSHLVEMIALGFNITLSREIIFRGRKEWIEILNKYGFKVLHEEHINTWYGFFVPHSLFVCEKRI